VPLRNEKVLPTIIVVIEQVRAPTAKSESRAAHARLLGHISKGAVAIVLKEVKALVGKVGDNDIWVAVVTPAGRPTSVNVPFPLLWYKKLGTEWLATKMSVKPSSS